MIPLFKSGPIRFEEWFNVLNILALLLNFVTHTMPQLGTHPQSDPILLKEVTMMSSREQWSVG
jgi:hypothetical protein